MKVYKGRKLLIENKDYKFCHVTGAITFFEQFVAPKKWWQFWKKSNKTKIIYE